MLRNFHYIDDKGKDQGINVRNRSKELSELLQDLDRVRQERKKAKQNKNKYSGVGKTGYSGSFSGSAGPSFTSASGSRYGGFGSDSYNPGQSRLLLTIYGILTCFHTFPTTGSSMGGGSSYPDSYPSSARSTTGNARRDSFEEYDAGDDEVRSGAGSRSPGVPAPIKKDTPVIKQAKTKEVNLFDFDDDDNLPVGTGASTSAAPAPAAALNKLSLDGSLLLPAYC